jgi:2-iminobutanoate/2-iminopropanoate deaminase
MKTAINTANAPQPKGMPYSQAIVSGNIVFTAGQIPLTPEGKILDGTTEEQVHQTMNNLKEILSAAGVNFNDVVKTTIYVTDMSIYPIVNEIYGSYLRPPYPARETVCVKELPLGAKVEISMVATKS